MFDSGRWMRRKVASSEQLMGTNIAVDPLTPVELRVGIADSGRGAAPVTAEVVGAARLHAKVGAVPARVTLAATRR